MVQVCLNGARGAADGALVAMSPGAMADSAADAVSAARSCCTARTAAPGPYSPVTGGRAIAEAVSPAYLTRKGGTEYE